MKRGYGRGKWLVVRFCLLVCIYIVAAGVFAIGARNTYETLWSNSIAGHKQQAACNMEYICISVEIGYIVNVVYSVICNFSDLVYAWPVYCRTKVSPFPRSTQGSLSASLSAFGAPPSSSSPSLATPAPDAFWPVAACAIAS